jgi:hypothetical protein
MALVRPHNRCFDINILWPDTGDTRIRFQSNEMVQLHRFNADHVSFTIVRIPLSVDPQARRPFADYSIVIEVMTMLLADSPYIAQDRSAQVKAIAKFDFFFDRQKYHAGQHGIVKGLPLMLIFSQKVGLFATGALVSVAAATPCESV